MPLGERTTEYIHKRLIGLTQQCGELEFVGRADSQVVRKVCVAVSALTRSVSFFVQKLEFIEFPVIANQ